MYRLLSIALRHPDRPPRGCLAASGARGAVRCPTTSRPGLAPATSNRPMGGSSPGDIDLPARSFDEYFRSAFRATGPLPKRRWIRRTRAACVSGLGPAGLQGTTCETKLNRRRLWLTCRSRPRRPNLIREYARATGLRAMQTTYVRVDQLRRCACSADVLHAATPVDAAILAFKSAAPRRLQMDHEGAPITATVVLEFAAPSTRRARPRACCARTARALR